MEKNIIFVLIIATTLIILGAILYSYSWQNENEKLNQKCIEGGGHFYCLNGGSCDCTY